MMKNNTSSTLALFISAILLTTGILQFYIFHNNFPNYYNLVLIVIIAVFFGAIVGIFHYSTRFLGGKNLTESVELLKLKNKELSDANERYNMVARATSDTIWDWNIENNNFVWNKGLQGVFGHQKHDIIEDLDWWFDKIHPQDSLKISVKIYAAIAEPNLDKWYDEYRFRCGDGSFKYVINRGFFIRDKEKKAIRMIGAIQDVTKQKTEEQRLRLFETVITKTNEAVILCELTEENENNSILFVNPVFHKITGYDSADVIGNPISSILRLDDNDETFDEINLALKKKENAQFQIKNKKKSGEVYWVNLSITPITDKDNQQTHWIFILRDITTEKQKEEEREQLIIELTQNNKDLKQFSYITAHNLKAPLSNLTSLLSLLEDIHIEDEELQDILDGFTKSTELLNDTINDLSEIIVIKDNMAIDKEMITIADTVDNIINQLGFLLLEKKPKIILNYDKNLVVYSNKLYFESIVMNLMTNALKYNNPENILEIEIGSHSDGKFTYLDIKDNGLGIDLKKYKDKIFGLYQRFHNYPDSKGLGLYLVKSQVISLGGDIHVKSEVGVGTTFTIKLPITENLKS
ncbi:MAG: PAS domain S-box-containing protein [Flavobacterium sp.]|jgi:PAS domain S-box-containing protein